MAQFNAISAHSLGEVQVRRWIPHRAIVLVADSSFAALAFLDALRQLPTAVSVVTRLRLDAALNEPAPERQPKQIGRPPKVGQRLRLRRGTVGEPVNFTLRLSQQFGITQDYLLFPFVGF